MEASHDVIIGDPSNLIRLSSFTCSTTFAHTYRGLPFMFRERPKTIRKLDVRAFKHLLKAIEFMPTIFN